jgi:hypothetical protein
MSAGRIKRDAEAKDAGGQSIGQGKDGSVGFSLRDPLVRENFPMNRQSLCADQLDLARFLSANDDRAWQRSFFVFASEDINDARENLRRDMAEPAEGVPVLGLDARVLRTLQKIVHADASVTAEAKRRGSLPHDCQAAASYILTVRIEPSRD